MSAPLWDYWTVDYHFTSDAFSVRQFPDYLGHAQRAWLGGRFFDSVILALHPTRDAANDECEIWKDRRDKREMSVRARLEELRRYTDGLESQLDP